MQAGMHLVSKGEGKKSFGDFEASPNNPPLAKACSFVYSIFVDDFLLHKARVQQTSIGIPPSCIPLPLFCLEALCIGTRTGGGEGRGGVKVSDTSGADKPLKLAVTVLASSLLAACC